MLNKVHSTKPICLVSIKLRIQMTKSKDGSIREDDIMTGYLLSKIRFSAFTAELARDSVKTFSLSTYLKAQKYNNG